MKTIRQQLTRRLLLTGALLIGVGGAAVYFSARAALVAQFDATLRAKAQSIASLTKIDGGRVEVEFSDELFHSFDTGGRDFFELRLENNTLERSPSLHDAHLPTRESSADRPAYWNLILPNEHHGRAVALVFRPQEKDDERRRPGTPPAAPLLLVVATVRHELDRTLTTLQLVLAGGGALLLLGTALGVPRVLRRELAPLQLLADHAARIDAATLSTRFPVADLPGELAPISARLNELLARLEESFERERRFSSDVAHEFRTPVAELRAFAELAVKLPDARAANADQEVLAVALHLEAVLTQLLALARGEQAAATRHERVALAPLLDDVCGHFQRAAAARSLAFRWHAPSTAETVSDPALLRSILLNLVDNAVEYTPLGGAVAVEASVAAGRFTVRVLNTVDNLDAADLSRLFDRFWRKDPSRTGGSHSGLGLPLARQFARALGCELTAAFAAPGQLALTLTETRPEFSSAQPVVSPKA